MFHRGHNESLVSHWTDLILYHIVFNAFYFGELLTYTNTPNHKVNQIVNFYFPSKNTDVCAALHYFLTAYNRALQLGPNEGHNPIGFPHLSFTWDVYLVGKKSCWTPSLIGPS